MTLIICPGCRREGLLCTCPNRGQTKVWDLCEHGPRWRSREGCGHPSHDAAREYEKEINAMRLKDSGERVQHETGAVRDSAKGRGRPDLLSPIMLHRVAVHLEAGAEKYEERNWEKGLPVCRAFASLLRHVWLWFQRYEDEDHLAAVICNAMFIMHTLEMVKRGRLPMTLDDRPDYRPEAKEAQKSLAFSIPHFVAAELGRLVERQMDQAKARGYDADVDGLNELRGWLPKS